MVEEIIIHKKGDHNLRLLEKLELIYPQKRTFFKSPSACNYSALNSEQNASIGATGISIIKKEILDISIIFLNKEV